MPTVQGLAAMGLAREEIDPRNSQRYFRVSAEGQKMLSDIMARNGRKAAEWQKAGGRNP